MSSSIHNSRVYQPLQQTDDDLEQQTPDQSQQNDEDPLPHPISTDDKLGTIKPKEISTWKITMNMLNYLEGIGFLAFPYALKEGGITAVVAFFVLPFVTGYTANLLAECLDEEDECGRRTRKRWTYQDIGRDCWPPFNHIIWVILSLALFTTTVSYIVLCGSLLSKQFPHVPITESQWACLGTLLVLPTVFLKQFSQVAWISLISFIALIASAALALTYEFQEVTQWDFYSLLFWDTRGTFVAMSMICFGYSIHGLCVPMAAEVSDLSKFRKALVFSYLFSAAFKFLFAVSGFLTYTGGTNEVILNNLPPGIPIKIIATFFTLNVLLTYPLPVLVILTNIEELSVYEKLTSKVPPAISFVLLRITLPLVILGFAFLMPHFALVNALTGSLSFFLTYTFPGLFHLMLKYKHLSKFEVLVDVILIIMGTLGAGFGLVTTIISFVQT